MNLDTRPHANNTHVHHLYEFVDELKEKPVIDDELKLRGNDLAQRMKTIISKFDEPLNLVVAGGFNAGKSTFINAFIENEIMPVNVKRETSSINRLIYGERREIHVVFKQENEKQDLIIPYEQGTILLPLVKKEMDSKTDRVTHIDIVYPDELFLKSFSIVDTPGLDFTSEDSAKSDVWIEEADALIWLVNFEGIRQNDFENICSYRNSHPKSDILCVLNGIDQIEKNEVDDAIEYMNETLSDIENCKTFSISAKQAFDGKNISNKTLYDDSNFSDVRVYLFQNILEKKREMQEQRIAFFTNDIKKEIISFRDDYRIIEERLRNEAKNKKATQEHFSDDQQHPEIETQEKVIIATEAIPESHNNVLHGEILDPEHTHTLETIQQASQAMRSGMSRFYDNHQEGQRIQDKIQDTQKEIDAIDQSTEEILNQFKHL